MDTASTEKGSDTKEIFILIGFGDYNKTRIQDKDTYRFRLTAFFQKMKDDYERSKEELKKRYKQYLFLRLRLKRGYLRSLDGDKDYINVAAELKDDSLNRDIIEYEINTDNNGKGYEDFDNIDVDTKMKFQDNNELIEDFNFEDCDRCSFMTEIENITIFQGL